MRDFSLANRVPEISALEPRAVARLHERTSLIPLLGTTHRRFVAGVLSMGTTQGYALDLGTGPGYLAIDVAQRNPDLEMIGLDLGSHMSESQAAGPAHQREWTLTVASGGWAFPDPCSNPRHIGRGSEGTAL